MLRKHKVCLIGLSFAFFILLLSTATLGANTPVTSFSETKLPQPEAANSLAQLPPPPGMVSYWEFNEGGGMLASDSIGFNDGTLRDGGMWVPGIAGTGLDLAPRAFVECGGDPSLSIQTLLTIEAWVMLPDTQGIRTIVQNGNDIMNKMYHFAIEDGFLYFDRYDGSSSPANVLRSFMRLNPGGWHHVVVLMDEGMHEVKFYLDGAMEPHGFNDPYLGLTYSRFTIGYGQDPMTSHSPTFFNGLIDEVAVYNELLSDDVIQQHYQNGQLGLGYLDGGIQEPDLEAVDDSFTAHEDVMLSVAAPGVLLNDIGDGLTAVLESGPSSGTLSFYGDGSFQYMSFPDSNGVDTFTYSVTDGFTVSNIATVTITVNPVNDAPVGVDDSYAIDEDTPLDLVAPGILENDSDIDGDSLIAVLVDAPLHGSVVLNADGSLNYIPVADWYGTDYFAYQAFDGTDYSGIVTVTIEVIAVGDAPRAQDDFYITDENVPLIIDALSGVLVNDTDPDDDVLASQIVTYPSHGLLDFNVDGSFTYTPNPDWYGVDTFVYQVMDGMLLDTATVTITVIPANKPPVAVDDFYTTNEDFVLNIDAIDGVLANDTDENGDALIAVLVSGSSHGLLVLNPDGSFAYTPDPDWYGVDSFDYEVSDGELIDIGTVMITVNSINDYPVALDDTYVVDEDGVLVVDSAAGVLANDYDVDGDALEAYWTELPTNGDLHFNLDGSFTYTPNPDFWGVDSFAYLVYDGIDASEFATVTITVNAVQDAPVAVDDFYSMDEDTELSTYGAGIAGVLTNDYDADGDPLEAVLVDYPVYGTLSFDPDGNFLYVPEANFYGIDSFTYYLSDGVFTSNTVIVTITVNSVNDYPVAVDDIYAVDEDGVLIVDSAAGVLANDYDVDGDALEAYWTELPTNGDLHFNLDGSFTYTPNPNFWGTDFFTYLVYDGIDASEFATVTITVNAVNDAPIADDDDYSTNEDTPLIVPYPGVLNGDIDVENDPLTTALITGPVHGVLILNSDGSFDYIPDANFFGTDTFTYVASDGALESNVATVTIEVVPINDAPVASDDFYTTDEDTLLSTYGAGLEGVLGNDYDVDGDLLEVYLVQDATYGYLALDWEGNFEYMPYPDFFGIDTFTYYVYDGSDSSSAVMVAIEVLPINDAPVAHEDEYQMDEDGVLSIPTPGLLINDYDVDGDFIIVDDWSDPTHGILWVYEDGSFEFIPDPDWNGVVTFEYWVFDGLAHSNVVTVTIFVNPVNDAPVAVDDFYSTDEDTELSTYGAGIAAILVNDYDADGDPLEVYILDYPAGTLISDIHGDFLYIPNPDFWGTDLFTYYLSDGVLDSNIATVTIIVNSVNDAPVAHEDEYQMDEDGVLSIPTPGLLINDYDVDGDFIIVDDWSDPTHGILWVYEDGSFEFIPDPDWNGVVTFEYWVFDGLLHSNVVTVTIYVLPVDDPPVAVDDYVTTDEDTPITIDVLANDYDIEGDSFDLIGYGWNSAEPRGELTLVDVGGIPMIRYTPDSNWHGSAWFTYNIGTTGSSQTDLAYVYITVNSVEDAPVAVDDAYPIDEDGVLQVDAASGVLANDYDGDGDSLTLQLISNPSHGSLLLNPDGSFTYTPDPNWNGMDLFIYEISDGDQTDTATVAITVSPVDDPPVAVDDYVTTDEDTPITIDVLANDYDIEGDSFDLIGYGWNSAEPRGELTLVDVGGIPMIRYTPDSNWHGSAWFTYNIGTTGSTETDLAYVYITVNPVNDPPVAVDDYATTDEDTPMSISVLANDWDLDSDSISIVSVTQPLHGMTVDNGDGTVTYHPDLNYYGADSFTYTITDSNGGTDTGTVGITVVPVNDFPVGVDDEYTIDEDTPLILYAPGLLANDYDVDGDTITLVVVTVPSHGSGSIGADGSFSYTPDADWYGTDGMTYQVFDGTDYSGIVTVTITVDPVNDAPVGVDDEYTIDEDGSLSVPAPGVLANDYDVDGDSLSTILVSPPYGSSSFSANGALNYNPPANWHGVTTLTYKVFDGTDYSGIVTVTITVNSVNDAPVGVNDEYTIDEDTSLHLVAPGLLANDYDVDGDAITLVVVTVPSHGSGSIGADGSFSYTPDADWYGTDGMTYKVFDGTDYSGIVTVTIIVNPVNDVPVAVDDYVVTYEDMPILIDFMGNDYDVDDSFGWDYVAWVSTEINGELEIVYGHEVEPGVFRDVLRYTPNPDWYGSISTINYRISDTFGAQSSIARIYITVNPVNDAPVAVDDYITTDEDTSVIIDFMGNDYDVDNSFTFDYASWSTSGIHGELEFLPDYEIEPGIFIYAICYTPDPDWHGTASAITYGIKDSGGLTSTAQIFITVNSVNDPPVAVDDYVVTDEDTSVIIDFMANDYDIDSSFDWYSITRYLSELHGTADILHNYEVEPGVFRTVISYTPDPNWHGSTSALWYTIWDSVAVSETAYIHITV
ncbi:MAG: Ig-like domain-containing protein, partial [Candidatus Thorarchaeota archaeon]